MEFDYVKPNLVHDFFQIYSISKIPLKKFHNYSHFLSFLKCKISTMMNVVVKIYYENIPTNGKRSIVEFQKQMESTMEQVHKNHYFVFCKYLSMCDPTLGLDFLKEIQTHYNMNFEPEMLTKKL